MDFDDNDECFTEDTPENDIQEPELLTLPISLLNAKRYHEMAGEEVFEDEDQISIATHSHLPFQTFTHSLLLATRISLLAKVCNLKMKPSK